MNLNTAPTILPDLVIATIAPPITLHNCAHVFTIITIITAPRVYTSVIIVLS